MDQLNNFFNNLSASFGSTFPKILAAIIILIIGMIIAGFIKRSIKKLLLKTGIDSKINPQGKSKFSLAESLSKIIYWVVMIYLLIYILSMVGVTGVLAPLQNMLNEITGYIPNILAAGLIGFVGYMIANIGKEAVGLISGALETFSQKLGFSSNFNLTKIVQQLVFLVILIPVILIALDTLQISTISDPAKMMLTSLFDSIPNIIAAVIILLVFVIGGKFVASVVNELLDNLKVDHLLSEMGISRVIGNRSFSNLAAKTTYFFLVIFGLVSATEKLGFDKLTEILDQILELSGHILFGMVILFIGNQISLFIKQYFDNSGGEGVSAIARFATLGLFLAISLRYMGIADDIVNLAFGLTLGAVAVAFALSFGLGGRKAAGEQAKKFFKRFGK